MSESLNEPLNESDLPADPFLLFQDWFSKASKSTLNDPNAMCLSTIDEAGIPDSRIVLLKSFDKRGFVFFTNSLSGKGRSIAKHPDVALNFFWDPLGKQIRIQGSVEKIEAAESDSYFASRSRVSQLGAWASLQSQHLDNRETLERRVGKYDLNFPNEVPRPPHWHGFRVKPIRVEFWQNRDNRLHDRFVYKLLSGAWVTTRLYP